MSGRARGLTELFAAFGPTPVVCSLGQATAAEADGLVDVTLQPSGTPVQVRPLRLGARAAGGAFWPVEVDDECLVLFPGGDHQQAVAIFGFSSDAAPLPANLDTSPLFVHPDGTTFATSETAVVQAVVLEALLTPLQAAMTEIAAGLAAFGLPVTQTSALVSALPTQYRSVGVVSE